MFMLKILYTGCQPVLCCRDDHSICGRMMKNDLRSLVMFARHCNTEQVPTSAFLKSYKPIKVDL